MVVGNRRVHKRWSQTAGERRPAPSAVGALGPKVDRAHLPRTAYLPAHIARYFRAGGVDLLWRHTWHVCLVLEAGQQVCEGLLLRRMADRHSIEVNRHQPVEEDDGA